MSFRKVDNGRNSNKFKQFGKRRRMEFIENTKI